MLVRVLIGMDLRLEQTLFSRMVLTPASCECSKAEAPQQHSKGMSHHVLQQINPKAGHQPQALSPSYTLNEDILDDVFRYLRCSELASVALVCRLWNYVSERRLYAKIRYSDLMEHRPAMTRLATTLENSSRIRGLIRELDLISYAHEHSAEFFQWLLLLPPNTIHTISVRDTKWNVPRTDFTGAVLGSPAFATVRHLFIEGGFLLTLRQRQDGGILHQGPKFEDIMRLPNLESLSISLVRPPLGTSVAGFSSLRRLSVIVLSYNSQIRTIVQHLRHSLIRFDIVIDRWDNHVPDTLSADLATFAQLRHLSIIRREQGEPFKVNTPFMDDLIEKLTGLETLYCAHDLFTGNLLRRIPSSLIALRLETKSLSSDDIVDACLRRRASQTSLRLLKIGGLGGRYNLHRAYPPHILDQCDAAGISFQSLERIYWATLFLPESHVKNQSPYM